MTTDILPQNSSQFYTYIHIRNDTGAVFYVGKGKGNRAWGRRSHNKHWNRIVAKHGHTVNIVAYFADEKDALNYEIALIAKYRAEGLTLANQTEGGEGVAGYVHTPETRAKLSALQIGNQNTKGHKHSAETRAKIGAKSKGNQNMLGRKASDETRAKMSVASKGMVHTAATREKISAARRAHGGHPTSAETRAKISIAMRGIKRSPETRAKLVLSEQRKRERRLLCQV